MLNKVVVSMSIFFQQLIEENCEVSLRSSNQQPPNTYVKCDRLQPWIEPIT